MHVLIKMYVFRLGSLSVLFLSKSRLSITCDRVYKPTHVVCTCEKLVALNVIVIEWVFVRQKLLAGRNGSFRKHEGYTEPSPSEVSERQF